MSDTSAIGVSVDDDPVPSPCISVCKMDPMRGAPAERAAGGLCTGCLRTIDEIVEWGTASIERKQAIVASIGRRTSV